MEFINFAHIFLAKYLKNTELFSNFLQIIEFCKKMLDQFIEMCYYYT